MPLRLVTFATCIAAGLLAGCGAPQAPPPSSPPAPAAAPTSTAAPAIAATDAWIGQWTGPEGTFLRIEPAGAPGRYAITIRDLDQARRYEGRADGQLIRFDRDGSEATIRAGDGDATGMKWLAGKHDCLVIAPGEGYCRD